MKILVTGGAGYIGSAMAHKLIEEGHSVLIFDNLSTGFKELIDPRANFINGDLTNKIEINNVFKKESIDSVFHFAAFSQIGESVNNPNKYYRNNVIGSLNLFNSMIENNTKRIIFSSSAAIFGSPKSIPIQEESKKDPKNPYGETKLFIEKILDNFDKAYGLKSVCLRYFNAGGALIDSNKGEMHNPESHLIPLILKTAKKERDFVEIFGSNYDTPDGTCIRDYIHISDIIDAHLLSLEFMIKENKSEKFNIGTGKGYSVKEVIRECKKTTGIDFEVRESPPRAGDPPKLVASNSKISQMLGWKAKYGLKDIIAHAWNWENRK